MRYPKLITNQILYDAKHIAALKKAAKPLSDWLKAYSHPHTKIAMTAEYLEVLSGRVAISLDKDFPVTNGLSPVPETPENNL